MNKKLISSLVWSLPIAVLLASSLAQALDFGGIDVGVQPRFETGVMFYDFEQKPGAETIIVDTDLAGNPLFANTAQGELRVKDTLPFIGGGLTVFANRFFIDFSAQYAFDGQDDSSQTLSSSNEAPADGILFFSQSTSQKDDFDRTDYAISAGYAMTESLAFFAGYKRSDTNFEFDRVSRIHTQSFNFDTGSLQFVNNTAIDKIDSEVEQDGPFIGIAYGWNINKGFMKGGLTTNLAVAFLDSKIKQKFKGRIMLTDAESIDAVTGVRQPLPDEVVDPDPIPTLEGDTVGLSLGITWRGFTSIDGLTYTVGINGYDYSFDGKTALADFDERVINFKAGIAYSF